MGAHMCDVCDMIEIELVLVTYMLMYAYLANVILVMPALVVISLVVALALVACSRAASGWLPGAPPRGGGGPFD